MTLRNTQKGIAPFVIIAIIATVLVVGVGSSYGYNKYKVRNEIELQEKMEALDAQNEKIALLEQKLLQMTAPQVGTTTTLDAEAESSQNLEIQKQLDDLKKQNSLLKTEITKKVAVVNPPPLPPPPPTHPTVAPIVAPPALPPPSSMSAALSTGAIISKVKPSVVSVTTRRGSGSGFLVSGSFVVTNAHVVDSVYRTTIGFNDGQVLTGYVSGRDEINDIAIIAIPRVSSPVVTFGNSAENVLVQGDKVYAFGFPFGLTGEASFTEGSISRRVTQDGISYLEISNTIHPGNSGGPLANDSGDIVGMNTSVYGYNIYGVSIGETIKFAIPGDKVKAESARLMSGAQTISAGGKAQIESFENFMTTLNAVSSDVDTVAEYRKKYVNEQNIPALTQLVASSTAVADRATANMVNVPALPFSNILKTMAENRNERARTLVKIYETEIELVKGKFGNNVTTAIEASLATLDKKYIDLDIAYEKPSDQLHEVLKTYTFY